MIRSPLVRSRRREDRVARAVPARNRRRRPAGPFGRSCPEPPARAARIDAVLLTSPEQGVGDTSGAEGIMSREEWPRRGQGQSPEGNRKRAKRGGQTPRGEAPPWGRRTGP